MIHAHHFEGLLVSIPASVRYRIPLVFDAHVLLDGELEYYDMGMPSTGCAVAPRGCSTGRCRGWPITSSRFPKRSGNACTTSTGCRWTRITVVGNGVERPFFEGRKGAYPADGMQRVVFAGNLASYQGVDLLLQAFVHVSRARQDVKLTMVTDSPTAEFAAAGPGAGPLRADRVRRIRPAAAARPAGERRRAGESAHALSRRAAETAQLHGLRDPGRVLRWLDALHRRRPQRRRDPERQRRGSSPQVSCACWPTLRCGRPSAREAKTLRCRTAVLVRDRLVPGGGVRQAPE